MTDLFVKNMGLSYYKKLRKQFPDKTILVSTALNFKDSGERQGGFVNINENRVKIWRDHDEYSKYSLEDDDEEIKSGGFYVEILDSKGGCSSNTQNDCFMPYRYPKRNELLYKWWYITLCISTVFMLR